jgi:hypothetical protein
VNNIMFKGVGTQNGASHNGMSRDGMWYRTVCCRMVPLKMVNVTKCSSITKQCVQKMVIDAINDEKRPFISL